MASIFKHWRTTYERIDKYLSDTYFVDVNLYGKQQCQTTALLSVSHFNEVTQPPHSSKDNFQSKDNSALSFSQIMNSPNQWTIINPDSFSFGPTWSVHWFKVTFRVPDQWVSKQDTFVELQWNSGCEVLVYSSTGSIVTALNSIHSRISVPLSYITATVQNENVYYLYLQASCSDLFGAGVGGMIRPPSKDQMFKIEKAKLVLMSSLAVIVARDLKILLEIADAMKDNERGHRALFAANDAVNSIVDLSQRDFDEKLLRAQATMDKFFAVRNGGSSVTLHAMAHCHIDTAWLWRYGETRRKIARSWSTTLRLLERYPNMTFVCSQALQLEWLKEDYPELFSQLLKMASKNQFLPVGGTWIEMDVNIPCFESLCRQFLYGQRFFKENFGSYCKEFWLPDTFGYTAQLPQIMLDSNIARFMTQKLSWSLVNKFPHHTFWWKGLDGSRVLTHFPPGDSYSMSCKVAEILHSVNNFCDKGRSSSMMFLYGYGDGGQGPTENMVQVLDRLSDCDGLPRIVHSSPDKFFQNIEDMDGDNLCTWVGELFLELHNGTYTSQRQIKKGNVYCEQLLRVVEFLVCLVAYDSFVDKGDVCVQVIKEKLEFKWKLLLLNQFHDVLPGSSIEMVCDDAYWALDSIIQWCCASIKELGTLLTRSDNYCINPTSWPLLMPMYRDDGQEIFGFFNIDPYTIATYSMVDIITLPEVSYLYDSITEYHRISNQYIEVLVDDRCRIISLTLKSMSQIGNVCNGLANELFLYDDVPLYWDAWDVMDYHLETGVALSKVASYRLKSKATVSVNKECVTLSCEIALENTGTVIEKCVSLCAHLDYVKLHTKVTSWNETHKLLKVGMPLIVNANEVQYRTQAGIISRPNHRNTSWDWAKFEVCSHEWIHVGEANWGVSLLKEAIFGSSALDGTLFLSLLRSCASPDDTADKKHLPHLFNYAIYPFQVASADNRFAMISKRAAQFSWLSTLNETFPHIKQIPIQHIPAVRSFPLRLVSPLSGAVTIDWIKPTCDDSGWCVVRVHEQIGGRYVVTLKSKGLSITEAFVTNILEERKSSLEQQCLKYSIDTIELTIAPFKVISVAISFQ